MSWVPQRGGVVAGLFEARVGLRGLADDERRGDREGDPEGQCAGRAGHQEVDWALPVAVASFAAGIGR